jgi:mRNA interferase MazF
MLVDQIRSIDVTYVVGDPVDYLTRDQLAEVDLAVAHYLGVQDASPPRFS